MDVNLIHKARYSVQLSFAPVYICQKKAHEAGDSTLPLYSWAKECSLSSRMFNYWMLIMKFQINYLVFIRSMREGNFKLFDKILIFLVKWFFIFDQYSYVRWLSVDIQGFLSLPITRPKLYIVALQRGTTAKARIVVDWCGAYDANLNDYIFSCTCKRLCIRCKCVNIEVSWFPFCSCVCIATRENSFITFEICIIYTYVEAYLEPSQLSTIKHFYRNS